MTFNRLDKFRTFYYKGYEVWCEGYGWYARKENDSWRSVELVGNTRDEAMVVIDKKVMA